MERRLVETWQSSEPGWRFGLCKVCGAEFPAKETVVGDFRLPETVCEDCGPMVTAHYALNREVPVVTLTPWWDEYCPDVYRELITSKAWPPGVDRKAVRAVMDWQPSSRSGLYLYGASGAGKTLALWAKARQLEREGRKPVMLSAVEFARKLACAARDLTKAEWLMQAGVLIIDDLGKEKLSAAVAPLIWEVMDERCNRHRPTLISARFSGAGFVARFADPVLGEDIRGRISDSTAPVRFGATAGEEVKAA